MFVVSKTCGFRFWKPVSFVLGNLWATGFKTRTNCNSMKNEMWIDTHSTETDHSDISRAYLHDVSTKGVIIYGVILNN